MSSGDKEGYRNTFLENRSAYNRKIRIDRQSFRERGLSVISCGVTGFSESGYLGTVCVHVCLNIRMDAGLDYDHARMDVSATLMDAEHKVLLKEKTFLRDQCTIDIPADAVGAASVIEISAIGDIPARKTIGGGMFIIDTASFEKRGVSPMSAGITEDIVAGTHIITVLLELSVINAHMLAACRQLKVFASFRDRKNAVIRNVYTELPCMKDGQPFCLVRIAYETSAVRGIGSVGLSMINGEIIHGDALTEIYDAKSIKPGKKRKKKPPVITDDDDDLSAFSMSGFDDDEDDLSLFSLSDDFGDDFSDFE